MMLPTKSSAPNAGLQLRRVISIQAAFFFVL
jgi:hypothetical protein